MADALLYLPEIEGLEHSHVQRIMNDYNEKQAREFALIYRNRRKSPDLVLVLNLIGFLGVAGVHRLIMGQIGMGLLYLLTGGLCLIGTIVDIVNHKSLAFEFNRKVADQVAAIVYNMNLK
ncbi:MAG: NINE protein [Bacteroidales bacterium]|nr:NINE protein [Bacteroidales bacterium]